MSDEKPHTEWFHLEVRPKSAGYFGGAFVSGVHRTPKEAEALAEEMKHAIKRHVDSVGAVYIVWEEE